MEVRHPNVPWVTCGPSIGGSSWWCKCTVCGADMGQFGSAQAADMFARVHSAHQSASPTHYGLGDLIAKATSAVGIKPCSPCEARRRAMNGAFPQVMRRR